MRDMEFLEKSVGLRLTLMLLERVSCVMPRSSIFFVEVMVPAGPKSVYAKAETFSSTGAVTSVFWLSRKSFLSVAEEFSGAFLVVRMSERSSVSQKVFRAWWQASRVRLSRAAVVISRSVSGVV